MLHKAEKSERVFVSFLIAARAEAAAAESDECALCLSRSVRMTPGMPTWTPHRAGDNFPFQERSSINEELFRNYTFTTKLPTINGT